METEIHPLPPFLPQSASLLMLGSFPPQRKRWSMDFYYPNWNNDMWRIIGLLFFQDTDYFTNKSFKTFQKDDIVRFLTTKGIALYDVATRIRRLQDNASDKYLEIVSPTQISGLLYKLPLCKAIATTGQKATAICSSQFAVEEPLMGSYVTFPFGMREIRLYRMPSTSRAYPLSLKRKAEFYRAMFQDIQLL